MCTIKTGRSSRGSTSVKFAILLMLLAGLWVAVDYRLSIPGSSLIDRLYAEPVVLDVDSLTGRETEREITQTYHYLHHTCVPEPGPLGDHVCWSTVSKFNGIDARLIAFFFRDDRLSAVRVLFRAEHHPEMFAQMEKRFGAARPFGGRTDAFGNNIVGWTRHSGFVATNDRMSGNKDALLLWLSTRTVLNKAFGKS
jgi:hypothetical protein